MRSIARLAAAALALTLPLAAGAQEPPPAPPPAKAEPPKAEPSKPAPRARRGDRTRISPEELTATPGLVTALDAVRMLRPWWLAPPPGRMASSNFGSETRAASELVAYIDGMRQPDVESSLVTVQASEVVEIRYLDQNRAVQMYGPGHEAGVLEVKTNATDKKRKP